MTNKQIRSKERVKDLGEVFTNEREVKAMMDLLKDSECHQNIDTKFLEPACGNGNFLVEILYRKFEGVRLVENFKDGNNLELLILRAVRSIYAIDICPDNVNDAIHRLMKMTQDFYFRYRGNGNDDDSQKMEPIDARFLTSIFYILTRNIIVSDFINKQDQLRFSNFIVDGEYVQEVIYDIKEIGKSEEEIEKSGQEYIMKLAPKKYNQMYLTII